MMLGILVDPISQTEVCTRGLGLPAGVVLRDTLRVNEEQLKAFDVIKLGTGYNCRGYVFIGAGRFNCLFDTGSSRNCASKSWLDGIERNEKLKGSVLLRETLDKPLECTTMDKRATMLIKEKAVIKVTFQETPNRSFTRPLVFLVVEKSTEDISLGKPTLDSLGFVSDRTTIELRKNGITFKTILPNAIIKDATFLLKFAENVKFEGRDDLAKSNWCNVHVPGRFKDGEWWVEAGENLPAHLQVVEGPLITKSNGDGRVATIEFLSEANSHSHSDDGFVQVRRITREDGEILEANMRMNRDSPEPQGCWGM
jgi:hypothetical protein